MTVPLIKYYTKRNDKMKTYTMKEVIQLTEISTKQINSFRKSEIIDYLFTSQKKYIYTDKTISDIKMIKGFEELRPLFKTKIFLENNIGFNIDECIKTDLLLIVKTKLSPERRDCLIEMIKSRDDHDLSLLERFNLYYSINYGTLESNQLKYGLKQGKLRYEENNKARGFGNTLDGQIEKYGKEEGTKRFNLANAKKVQSLDNFIKKHGETKGEEMYNLTMAKKGQSLDKFVSKYGKEDGKKRFDKWVNSCAATKDNFIKRHGENDGIKKWELFKKRSKSTKENFISRHGYLEGTKRYKQYCERSANTKENFIRVHGEELGIEKWNKYINNANTFRASTESLEIFNPLTKKLILEGIDFEDIFYGIEDSFEFKLMYDEEHYYSYDYTIESLKIIIEYNGSHVHPSKEKLTEQEWRQWKSPWTKEEADTKYKFDSDKIKFAEKSGYKVITIWDYENKEKALEKCLNLVKERI